MDWFKRYGIPGAYFIGLTLVWLMILYPCRIDLSDEETLKIVGGIYVGGFLPLGYLLCMVKHCYYFIFWKRRGLHARALLIYKANHKINNPLNMNDWATWAVEGIQNMWSARKAKINKKIGKFIWFLALIKKACSKLSTESNIWNSCTKPREYGQEWIRKRVDIVVMNQAIIVGTIVSTIVALCLRISPSWKLQPHYDRYWICISIALIILLLILWYVTTIFRLKINIAIAGIINLRNRPCYFGGTGTLPRQNNNTNQQT
jgi:hypothetical protein